MGYLTGKWAENWVCISNEKDTVANTHSKPLIPMSWVSHQLSQQLPSSFLHHADTHLSGLPVKWKLGAVQAIWIIGFLLKTVAKLRDYCWWRELEWNLWWRKSTVQAECLAEVQTMPARTPLHAGKGWEWKYFLISSYLPVSPLLRIYLRIVCYSQASWVICIHGKGHGWIEVHHPVFAHTVHTP